MPGVDTSFDGTNGPVSFAVDPSDLSGPPPPGLLSDVFYVVLEGNLVGPSGSTTLGYGRDGDLNCVGKVILSNPVSGSVDLTDFGVGALPFHDGVVNPILTSLGQVAIENADLTTLFNAPPDQDTDGLQDGADRCVFEQDASNQDSGQLLGMAPSVDGVGDVCQCGDVDQSGAIFGPPTEQDVDIIWDHVLGLATSPEVLALGSVAGGPNDIDVRDIATLTRAIAGEGPGLSGVCTSALPH